MAPPVQLMLVCAARWIIINIPGPVVGLESSGITNHQQS
jgi:hypothetical protein